MLTLTLFLLILVLIYILDLNLGLYYPVEKRILEEEYITGKKGCTSTSKYYTIQYKSPLLRMWRSDTWATVYDTLEEARKVASFKREKKYYEI